MDADPSSYHKTTLSSTCGEVRPTGCNLALLIAYKNLKQRFAAQKAELTELRNQRTQVAVEDDPTSRQRSMTKEIERLERLLTSKTDAYNDLEASYQQVSKREELLVTHSTEIEQLLQNCERYQNEIQQLSKRCKDLELENMNLKRQLEEKEEEDMLRTKAKSCSLEGKGKGILSPLPDKSKSTTCVANNDMECKNEISLTAGVSMRSMCNMEKLGYECKHSATDKIKGHFKYGCIEENILSYVKKLERTILTLKETLDNNNNVINDLLLKKIDHVPQFVVKDSLLDASRLSSSYVTIDDDDGDNGENDGDHKTAPKELTLFSSDGHNNRLYELPALECASVIVPLDELISSCH